MPTPPAAQKFRSYKFAVPPGFNVDRAGGILRNLALITGDREAKGHGLYIDDETIATALACVEARQQLKGAMRHLSWEEYFEKGGDRVLDFPGWFSGFTSKAGSLVADKFEFYETFRTDPATAPAFARIMEIAEKTPNLIGLSIEAWGYAVFVAKDGKEYGMKPDGVELLYDGVPALRITDLFFAAFVDEPAATDGLFAKFSALLGGKQKLSLTAAAELDGALAVWAAKHLPGGSEVPVPVLSNDTSSSFSTTMKLFADLKAKITDPTRFAAAMGIVGNTPPDKLATLTVADVESQLVAVDLGAANKKVTDLTTDLGAANKKVTDLEKENTDLKAKFEKFKKSGKPDSVDLGAPSGGSVAGSTNPWAKETRNLSQQCAIEKSDPARAAELKLAAGVS